MSDSEVRRLEDRIDAVNREGQLRLDTAMARIDGKLEAVLGAVNTMKAENTGVAGTLKAENSAIRDTLAGLDRSVAEIRTDGRSTRTAVIVTAVAIFLGIAGVPIGLKQVWIGGVQVGQTVQTTTK